LSVAQPLVQASLIGEAIDHGPVFVIVADEDMRYVAVNQYTCDLLGYTREELLSLRLTDVATAPDASERFASFVAAARDEGAMRVTRKDGSELMLTYHAKRTSIAGMTLYLLVGMPQPV
jgi:PAS domain S-box-containing protein